MRKLNPVTLLGIFFLFVSLYRGIYIDTDAVGTLLFIGSIALIVAGLLHD